MDEELRTEFRLDDDFMLRAWCEDDVEKAFEIVVTNNAHDFYIYGLLAKDPRLW